MDPTTKPQRGLGSKNSPSVPTKTARWRGGRGGWRRWSGDWLVHIAGAEARRRVKPDVGASSEIRSMCQHEAMNLPRPNERKLKDDKGPDPSVTTTRGQHVDQTTQHSTPPPWRPTCRHLVVVADIVEHTGTDAAEPVIPLRLSLPNTAVI